MDAKPTCFVIMPIKQIGTPEHEYFKTLYQLVLQPTVAGLGYEVIRADEVYVTGAITKDIVLRLADADLVIADLTDLNPNVFYELGVRHSLRRGQTLMILDNERTRDIPFDISAYRVLQFHGNLSGLAQLRQDLVLHIGEPSLTDGTHRDNPVHDWLPALPPNALAAATGSNEGKLREQIAQLLTSA